MSISATQQIFFFYYSSNWKPQTKQSNWPVDISHLRLFFYHSWIQKIWKSLWIKGLNVNMESSDVDVCFQNDPSVWDVVHVSPRLCFPVLANSSFIFHRFRGIFCSQAGGFSCTNILKYREHFWMKSWLTRLNFSSLNPKLYTGLINWNPSSRHWQRRTHSPRKLNLSCFRSQI